MKNLSCTRSAFTRILRRQVGPGGISSLAAPVAAGVCVEEGCSPLLGCGTLGSMADGTVEDLWAVDGQMMECCSVLQAVCSHKSV